MMRKKLGIIGEEEKQDEDLIIELLTWMHKNNADYTYILLSYGQFKENIFHDEQFTKKNGSDVLN